MPDTVGLVGERLKVIVPKGTPPEACGYSVSPQRHIQPRPDLPTIPAAIEFWCGDCFKKAFIYEEGVGIVVDLIKGIVFPDKDRVPIVVEVYSKGKVVDKQFMDFIVVSLDNFCTGEFEVVRFDPKGPEHVAKSDFGLELGCGPVCKKVLNIKEIFPKDRCCCSNKIRDRIVSVFPPFNELLLIKAFTAGQLFEKQGVGQLFTLQSRICSREENVTQIDHLARDDSKCDH